MDARLVFWARAVKRRRRAKLPVLWLFTDEARLADPLPAIARLPNGVSGVVFRHDRAPDRAALALSVAAMCRARKLGLVVAGDGRLAARCGAGMHLRGGRKPGFCRVRPGLVTSSAHDVPEVLRARRAGAQIVFISPAFATASHASGRVLGPVRWRGLARRAGPCLAYALGGISGQKITELAGFCYGAGAIDALYAGISS
jgi:thiamine-phosphate pyrophosphorylase